MLCFDGRKYILNWIRTQYYVLLWSGRKPLPTQALTCRSLWLWEGLTSCSRISLSWYKMSPIQGSACLRDFKNLFLLDAFNIVIRFIKEAFPAYLETSHSQYLTIPSAHFVLLPYWWLYWLIYYFLFSGTVRLCSQVEKAAWIRCLNKRLHPKCLGMAGCNWLRSKLRLHSRSIPFFFPQSWQRFDGSLKLQRDWVAYRILQ